VASWKKQAILGAVKSALPFRSALRRVKRTISPYETNPKNDPGLLDQSLRQIGMLAALGIGVRGKTAVEIGTGWLPVLPLVYRMAGAESVITVDQERLVDRGTFASAIGSVRENLDRELENTKVDASLFDKALLPDGDADLASMCDEARVQLRSPFDFNDLPANSADIVASRTVLEHIPEGDLRRIFRSAKRILKPGGVMCHTIDMSDHFEHLDKSISRVNFLQYRPWIWKLACLEPQLFQNRLRRFEYENMLLEEGYEIRLMTGDPDADAMEALGRVNVCARYGDVPAEELAILDATIVASPAAPASR
jgi:SAM-dependent methyltransferase